MEGPTLSSISQYAYASQLKINKDVPFKNGQMSLGNSNRRQFQQLDLVPDASQNPEWRGDSPPPLRNQN